eukprot:scaffold1804_cov263-Pinguiococcus_pyrenoidosus.AAC.2
MHQNSQVIRLGRRDAFKGVSRGARKLFLALEERAHTVGLLFAAGGCIPRHAQRRPVVRAEVHGVSLLEAPRQLRARSPGAIDSPVQRVPREHHPCGTHGVRDGNGGR